jgi:murein DD-endopeptidase MepM/ murein hydrolase activator NlpD
MAFTPLREYVIGYTYINITREVVESKERVDSLNKELQLQTRYLDNLKNVIQGNMIDGTQDSIRKNTELSDIGQGKKQRIEYEDIELHKSKEDSELRQEIEAESRYDLIFDEANGNKKSVENISGFLFFPPVNGMITDTFNSIDGHYGIDLVAPENEAVKATLGGTVVISEYSAETGYVLGIQHSNNLLSFYKHNSVLLKRAGAQVKAGEAIAIIGNSGRLSTGPHLHFELWHNGNPVDPKDHLIF